jgi:predicted secreted Zn-dependent protease
MTDGLRGEVMWRRSINCEGGACVEVTATEDAVMVRNSAKPGAALVTVSHAEWREFLTRLKAEEP